MDRSNALLPALALALWAPAVTTAQDQDGDAPSLFTEAHVTPLAWRNVGPSNMGGRITDIAVQSDRPSIWYVATAGAGVFKTVNAGTTWKPLFTDQPVSSIGDVAVAPSNPDVVWVGSGEENARNSVSWGDGVYKSTDGGATFKHMGLKETFQIGHVAIHPADADIVFVAALGKLWGDNPDRGVYRTKDGGETWQRVLHIDDKTGCVDVRIDPSDPTVVYACMYQRQRDMFDSNDPAVRFGEEAGLFKSTDGGDTWRRITNGLPTCKWGRSGLTICATQPETLYMIVETERSGWATGTERVVEPEGGSAYMGIRGEDAEGGGAELTMITPRGPSQKAGLERGDVVLKLGDEEITTYESLTTLIRASDGGDKVAVTIRRGDAEQTIEVTYGTRRGAGGGGQPGGGGGSGPNGGRLGGQQMNRQTRQGEEGYQTGGFFRSDDRGETWQRVNSLTERPFYYSVIAVDPRDPDNVYSCGTSFYESTNGGKQFKTAQRSIHVDFHAVWVDPNDHDHLLLAGDGGLHETFDRTKNWRQIDNLAIGQFYNVDADTADPYRVYGGLQDNGTWAGPSRTRWREGITRSDWVTIYSGDGFRAISDPADPDTVFATSQNGGVGRVNMATASTGRVSKPDDAGGYNWNTPFFLSPHNSKIFYFAGKRACMSLDHGRNSETISPVLGLTDRGTATAMAESPGQAGLLYVGTDDGALWRSEDAGFNWEEIHDKVLGMPGPRYVSSIRTSWHDTDRVYVTFDGHRSDDFESYVYVSEDRGDTWKSLAANLTNEPCRVVQEDRRNQNLLFVGTEFHCYASLDRGRQWFQLGDLPTLPVHDLAIQDREGDLVAATHGRGIWICDIAPLRQMTPEVMKQDVHLFQPQTVTLWNTRSRVMLGHDEWRASNPASGTPIYLWTAEAPEKGAKVTVHDVEGTQLAALTLKEEAGLHVLQWNARRSGGERGGGRRGAGGRRGGGGSPVTPGDYAVRYQHGEEELVQMLRVRRDPDGTVTPLSNPVSTETPSRN